MAEVRQKWIIDGGVFYPVSGSTKIWDTPGAGVFEICSHPINKGQLGLRCIGDSFEFDFRIYDLGCKALFDKIEKTWTYPLYPLLRQPNSKGCFRLHRR